MTVRAEIEVVGIKDALREINSIDRVMRRQITKDFKQIGQPIVNEAKRKIPQQPPISGWGRSWSTSSGFKMLPWDGNAADGLIDTKVSGKRPKEFAGMVRDLAVVYIRWRGMVNTVFDTAGKDKTPQGANMVRGLSNRYGAPSRILWPAYEKHRDGVEQEIRDMAAEVMAKINLRLNKERL
jgi:hypothetical protein